eukprot:scaffold38043_cov176-Amphora_coffeaeformis.AAC.6
MACLIATIELVLLRTLVPTKTLQRWFVLGWTGCDYSLGISGLSSGHCVTAMLDMPSELSKASLVAMLYLVRIPVPVMFFVCRNDFLTSN